MEKKKKDRKAFNFMRSYYDAIETLPKNQQSKLYEAIVKYSFEDNYNPEFKGTLSTVWFLIKPVLDKSFTNYQNGSKKQPNE